MPKPFSTAETSVDNPFRVVIVGGGVAALEALLCLREFGGDRMSTTVVAPGEDFVYVPMVVQEPFGHPSARRYPLAHIVRDAGATLCSDTFAWLDNEFRVAYTKGGEQLHYDALLLAPGAQTYKRYLYSITLDPHCLDAQLHGLIQDIEGGHAHDLVFIIPAGSSWPLPIYELALMTAAQAYDASAKVTISIITPESAPLAIFGEAVSDEIERVLTAAGIQMITSSQCEVHGPGLVAVHPGTRELHADRVIALPQLFGPPAPGVPTSSRNGFISTDAQQAVPGLERVWAVGDATDFPIKFGGIAAQQAVVAAQSIAMVAGSGIEPQRFRPELHALLLTGGRPLMISADIDGRTITNSRVSEVAAAGRSPAKITSRYLTPYLRAIDRAAMAR